MIEKLRQCIDKSLTNDPDGGKGKKKTVQVGLMWKDKASIFDACSGGFCELRDVIIS